MTFSASIDHVEFFRKAVLRHSVGRTIVGSLASRSASMVPGWPPERA